LLCQFYPAPKKRKKKTAGKKGFELSNTMLNSISLAKVEKRI
jgi:hypothetical protein